MNTFKVRVVDSRVRIRTAFTRLPFRFGVVTIEAAAIGFLELQLEFADGSRAKGIAADILAYKWFDKNPAKTPADNVDDLLQALRDARAIYAGLQADSPFQLWQNARHAIESRAEERGFNRLIASFAGSMMERAIMDAVGRHTGLSFDQMVRANSLGIAPETVVPDITYPLILASLPKQPLTQIAVRHTIGLADPLTANDVGPDASMDGLPVSLEDYLQKDRLKYLKIKLSGDNDADIARLSAITHIIYAQKHRIQTTLDGNEQYKSLDAFVSLIEKIRATPALADFWENVLFIEQPLPRDVAMASPLSPQTRTAIGRPLLIDEADGWAEAYSEALEQGYEGVSHKNCKGVYRSLINSGLAHARNKADGTNRHFLSAEDLTNLATVPLQADLAVVATLGISHVERNGHHYFAGLSFLPPDERDAALARHPDLYTATQNGGAVKIENGFLNIASLQVPGLGVTDFPNLDQAIPEADWRFDMLEVRA